jgi:hypothetical protein
MKKESRLNAATPVVFLITVIIFLSMVSVAAQDNIPRITNKDLNKMMDKGV